MARLKELYDKEIKGKMKESLGYKNAHQVPRLEKIVVSCCTRDCVSNSKTVARVMEDLAAITGQKPVVARARKSIAAFKVRKGMALGAFVTLRDKMMYEFFDRLVNISLPRVRDFRGVSPKGFDGRGNFSLGLREHIMFAEIDYDKIDKIRGVGVSIVTTGKDDKEGRELLALLGMPFGERR